MSTNEACRNCRFSKTQSSTLICRRYPPITHPSSGGEFPIVDATDWCGEWLAMRPGAGLPAGIKPPKSSPQSGRVAGGHARAAALTAARRAEIASNAARSRWSKP